MQKKIYYILPSYNESLNLNELLSNFKRFKYPKILTFKYFCGLIIEYLTPACAAK